MILQPGFCQNKTETPKRGYSHDAAHIKIALFPCFRESELIVDDPVKYSEKIPVFINITLINVKCDCKYIVMILMFWTNRTGQTVQAQIRSVFLIGWLDAVAGSISCWNANGPVKF